MMVWRECILNIKLQKMISLEVINETTTATDTKDGNVTATFLEGRNFIPMPLRCFCNQNIPI